MKPSQTTRALKTLIAIRQPVFLWGPPGVGKSQLVAETAQELALDLVDIRAILLDPVDLRGLPRITETKRAAWCPPSFLPEDTSSSGILFLDELNAAPPLVQAACYQLVLDRRIGEYKLPDGWCVIAAGNRERDRSVTHHMPTALANRMVHIDCDVDLEDWLKWAQKAGIRREVTAFLKYRPKLLHNFDPQSKVKAFASPRSWEFLSRILETNPDEDIRKELFEGTIGPLASAEFLGFLKIWDTLPSVEAVLADPKNAPVPEEPAALYALAEALALSASELTLDALVTYADRLPTEYAVLLMRDAVASNQNLVSHPAFSRWAENNAEVLL
ncbi:MAG: MoxR family ATPase [Desulfovibrionaceae bacterium]|nr:MoxR family ATPase [Desulfovibrionaceae bacterium]